MLTGARAVKIFKQPDHPDFAASASQRAAAAARLAEHQQKLPDFPRSLPNQVIVPLELATDRCSGQIVGYAMKRVDRSESLYTHSNARTRRSVGLAKQTRVLSSLHEVVRGVHRAGVVIGDFNDLNILVSGETAHVIDADSFQFGGYRCSVYSERFLDPLLVEANGSVSLEYSESSDWYAFAVMVTQTLLSVGPFGGIHRPDGSAPRVPQDQRPRARLSIFNAPVRLPRPALPPEALPDSLRSYLELVFASDLRAPMALEQLESLRWTRCTTCTLEHARASCPHCSPRQVVPPLRASASARAISCPQRLAALGKLLAPVPSHWIDGRRLMRNGALGPVRVGDVLASSTRFWLGTRFGFGFYTASALRRGFVFNVGRTGINDRVELEPRRGTLAAAHCALSASRAWLTLGEAVGPAIRTTVTVVNDRGDRCGHGEVSDEAWAVGLAGACAIGELLFVPTDDGVVRVDIRGGRPVATKTFTATRSVVDSASQLVCDGRELYSVNPNCIYQLSCN